MNGGAFLPLIHFLFSLHCRVWKHHTASCYLPGSPFLFPGVLAVSTRGKKLRQRNQVKYVAVAMRSFSRGGLCVVCMLMLHCCTSVPCWVLAHTSGSHSRITVGGAGTAPVSLARPQKLVGGYQLCALAAHLLCLPSPLGLQTCYIPMWKMELWSCRHQT